MDQAINDGVARKRLAPLVAALFAGATLAFRQEQGPARLLCYRGVGELLPLLPRGVSVSQAQSGGLYVSAAALSLAGEVVDERWLGFGGFDALDMALNSVNAPDSTVTQMNMQLGFRRATTKGDVYATPLEIHAGVVEAEARGSTPQEDAQEPLPQALRECGG